MNNSELKEYLLETVDKITELTVEQRAEFLNLLMQYNDRIALSDFDFEATNLVQHQIDTQGATPFRDKVRPLPPNRQPQASKTIKEMLDHNLIERSCSAW